MSDFVLGIINIVSIFVGLMFGVFLCSKYIRRKHKNQFKGYTESFNEIMEGFEKDDKKIIISKPTLISKGFSIYNIIEDIDKKSTKGKIIL
jgi:hypothetical protein